MRNASRVPVLALVVALATSGCGSQAVSGAAGPVGTAASASAQPRRPLQRLGRTDLLDLHRDLDYWNPPAPVAAAPQPAAPPAVPNAAVPEAAVPDAVGSSDPVAGADSKESPGSDVGGRS